MCDYIKCDHLIFVKIVKLPKNIVLFIAKGLPPLYIPNACFPNNL